MRRKKKRQLVKELDVVGKSFPQSRALDFNDDVPAITQGRRVHLAE